MSEIRQNLLTGEWVIVAPERARRPADLCKPHSAAGTVPARSETCPFCPGNEKVAAEERFRLAGPDGDWRVRSLVNKFSVLVPGGEAAFTADPLGQRVSGVGLHEVIVEHRRHDLGPATAGAAALREVLGVWRQRFTAFYADPRIRHVVVFKNHGEDAGASQQHPHSQIVGLPMAPGQVEERRERVRRFFAERGRCLGCFLLEQELAAGARVVQATDDFVAYIPFAALSPFHLWIFPRHHRACFGDLDDAHLAAFADVLCGVLGRLYTALGNPAFNLVLRSLGPREGHAPDFHWYLSIVPRVCKAAGFELGSGMYVNSASPEGNAGILRQAALPAADAGD